MSSSFSKIFSQLLLHRSAWFIVPLQACLILFSLIVAWLLRFDFSLPYLSLLLVAAPILISVRLAAIGVFGLFHGWWRYTGISDIADILKGVGAGSVAFFLITYVFLGIKSFPRSVYVLEPLLTIGVLAGVRLLPRVIFESIWADVRSSKRVAIIGAGVAAQMIMRELRQPGTNCIAVACVDDDSSKRGIKVQGVPVMGSTDELPAILTRHPVDEILIAVPSATASQMQRFVAICERSGTRFRTAPALRELIAGEITVKQLREVNLEDLLGRQPVHIDLASVGPEIQGRTLLVTGAAGSIGSELCRQLLQFRPAKLICVDQSETGVFHLQRELANHEARVSVGHYVADVADDERMLHICGHHRPHVIFHAAAYKHVPIMESNPREAVKNNVFGLIGFLGAGEANGCQAFVLISSDKAVNPTSVMGATKRLGELIVSCRPASCMRCNSVRFGNVLGSNGSVIPLLQEQIRDGRELTITHPSVRRFFMTVHEAVSLVLQAFTIGSHGEVLVLDMDRPVRIVDLAKTLIRLSGKSLEEVKIRFTGLRPGEKVYEELFYPGEKIALTRYAKIRSARGETIDWVALESQLQELQDCCAGGNDAAVRTKLMSIVSGGFYRPNILPRRTARVETSAPRVLRRAAGQD
ncbi:MAG: nucleoside-diphosphate sugar epimerase/dehydratase [Candidatus Acidiferrales bacterium]